MGLRVHCVSYLLSNLRVTFDEVQVGLQVLPVPFRQTPVSLKALGARVDVALRYGLHSGALQPHTFTCFRRLVVLTEAPGWWGQAARSDQGAGARDSPALALR